MIQQALRIIIRSLEKNPRQFFVAEMRPFQGEREFKQLDPAELATETINALQLVEVGWTCWEHKGQISLDRCGPDSYPIFRMKGIE